MERATLTKRWPLPAGILAGVAADALLGDPRRGHPVAGFGRAAGALQARLYADSTLRGAAYTTACVALAAAPALAAARLTRHRPWAAVAAVAAATWAVTGAKSLAGEARRIGRALEAGDLDAARAALPGLCGRDPHGLDDLQISRAVVESVAENSGDAIVSPLVWGAAGGVTGLLAYRAINTLDAMVGYRSPRLARFGTASARLDDVANWLPARLTALLAAACAPAVGGRPAHAWRIARRYGSQHPSPNAGYCEAAFAGALGLRLGGANSYDGVAERRPELGEGRAPEAADIERAARLCQAVTAASAAVAALAAVVLASLPDLRRRGSGGPAARGGAGGTGGAGVVGGPGGVAGPGEVGGG
jgi:adenosylcobinamide-phosphate synthase